MSPELQETLITAAAIGGGIVVSIFLLIIFVKSFLIIGRPNELLIFSGRTRTLKDGTKVGWRVVRGGRSIKLPLVEEVSQMDLTTMAIDISIRGAYSKGNIPVHVDAVANAKLTTDPILVRNAIERFMATSQKEIRNVAKETLEGTLRGVIATLTPEELNHDRQKLSELLKAEVREDLDKLGLMVDTFRIQHVADDQNYLDSISRIRIAEVMKDAEIAESDATRDADQVVADSDSRGVVAHEEALTIITEKENELKRIEAELDSEARSEEERTIAAGREARAIASQKLETIRVKLEELRLQAEQVIPAEMQSKATELKAAGDAAIKEEQGRAEAEALTALYGAWTDAGSHAKEVFLIQQIDRILADVAKVTESLNVEHVNIIDNGDGTALASYIGSYPAIVTELLSRIKDTVGIDIIGILTADKGGK
jgi:flotillin